MADKVVGGAIALVCVLFGGFLTLTSLDALFDGKVGLFLYGLGAVGAILILGGFALLWKLTRRRMPKRFIEPEESW